MATSRKVIRFFCSVVIVAICALVLTISMVSAADIIFVGLGENYTMIQSAVAVANSSDTIIVRDGIYTENIDVTVDNLTIRSENGSANCIVNALNQTDHVFSVTADYVNISGFTVQDATGSGKAGIYLTNVDHCTISENIAMWNDYGIYLYASHNNNLTDNNAADNNYGIYLYFWSWFNHLTNNTANSNKFYGIYLFISSNYNNLTVNTASNNTHTGIYLEISSYNTLTDNTASKNSYGIHLYASSNNNILTNNTASNNGNGIYLDDSGINTLTGNTASSNNPNGIYLDSSDLNTLTGNTASSNAHNGIVLVSSSYNTLTDNTASYNSVGIALASLITTNNILTGNTASNNDYGIYLDMTAEGTNYITGNTANSNDYGIYLFSSSNNLIYNNYFNNIQNADDDGNNVWNISKTSGTNIIGGSWLGGNYWSDYTGEDLDGNGLGDTLLPYNSSGNMILGGDWLPLVKSEVYTKTDVGVTSKITIANSTDLAANLPPEYAGVDISNTVVLNVNVTDNTPGNIADDAYTDITISVGTMDIGTCKVFKAGMGFLPEVPDVKTLPTVKPPGEPAFSRNVANNTVTVRLYVGDPLLAVLPPAEPPIFDTGEGSYPSMSGTFTGTITPSRNLTVSTLSTYYCEGTGGHTRSFELTENTTPIASGVWGGYAGEWHNITFTEVTLIKDHEYRYVIETGSYPQIIHAQSFNATGGKITCTEFVDINGKRHEGWIPAIRLH